MQYILPLSSLCASILSLSFYFFSIIFIITTTTVATLKLPPNVTVPAILGFGDSIIDPGNNNNIKTIIKCNFPPYGQDFMGGISTGRFSNGRIPTDFLGMCQCVIYIYPWNFIIWLITYYYCVLIQILITL